MSTINLKWTNYLISLYKVLKFSFGSNRFYLNFHNHGIWFQFLPNPGLIIILYIIHLVDDLSLYIEVHCCE